MVLAELDIRHTRRHQPTRRVALDPSYLPMRPPANGAVLLAAVVAEFVPGLDEEQLEALPGVLRRGREGTLDVPGIVLRHRVQTDTHGLDRSRHRLLDEGGLVVVELDVHAHPGPQVLGAILAAHAMGPTARRAAFRAIAAAVEHPGELPEPLVVRRLLQGVPGGRPMAAAPGRPGTAGADAVDPGWRGVPAERRWAMEVLGMSAGTALERADVQRRFRRLLRAAHPDHGAERAGAAERIAELTEARELLLAAVPASAADAGDR